MPARPHLATVLGALISFRQLINALADSFETGRFILPVFLFFKPYFHTGLFARALPFAQTSGFARLTLEATEHDAAGTAAPIRSRLPRTSNGFRGTVPSEKSS